MEDLILNFKLNLNLEFRQHWNNNGRRTKQEDMQCITGTQNKNVGQDNNTMEDTGCLRETTSGEEGKYVDMETGEEDNRRSGNTSRIRRIMAKGDHKVRGRAEGDGAQKITILTNEIQKGECRDTGRSWWNNTERSRTR